MTAANACWLKPSKQNVLTMTDRTQLHILKAQNHPGLDLLPTLEANAILTDALAKTLVSKLDMTFVASEDTYPFVVGDVATNLASEYLMLRSLQHVGILWQELAKAPSVPNAKTLLQGIADYETLVTVNTSQVHLVLPSSSQMYLLQEHIVNFRAAANQLLGVQSANTGIIAPGALDFKKKEWMLIDAVQVRHAAALYHMKTCAQELKAAETVDCELLATAIQWTRLDVLPVARIKKLPEYAIIMQYAAAARSTNMQLPQTTVVADLCNSWA